MRRRRLFAADSYFEMFRRSSVIARTTRACALDRELHWVIIGAATRYAHFCAARVPNASWLPILKVSVDFDGLSFQPAFVSPLLIYRMDFIRQLASSVCHSPPRLLVDLILSLAAFLDITFRATYDSAMLSLKMPPFTKRRERRIYQEITSVDVWRYRIFKAGLPVLYILYRFSGVSCRFVISLNISIL